MHERVAIISQADGITNYCIGGDIHPRALWILRIGSIVIYFCNPCIQDIQAQLKERGFNAS